VLARERVISSTRCLFIHSLCYNRSFFHRFWSLGFWFGF
jgi:hypothetical protein